MTLSLTMIVKNESEVLARALDTAAIYADEIVVVDTGSRDDTKDIARRFTDKVFDFEWTYDFAAARNYAVKKSSGEYFMWLDADDVVSPKSAKGLAELKRNILPRADVVMLPYVMGENRDKAFYRERIIRNDGKRLWRGRVHEAIVLSGVIERADVPIVHDKPAGRGGKRNLDIYRRMIKDGEPFTVRDNYYYARELFWSGDYARAVPYFREVVSDKSAFLPNAVDSAILLSRCYMKQGERDRALETLLSALKLTSPSGELACEIAFWFFGENNYRQAAFWFERAIGNPDLKSGAFIDFDSYGFIPCVWLTVCYDRLGELDTAYYWHNRAKAFKPDHPSVLANQKYFDGVRK